MENRNISFSESLFYIMLLCFMGAKAVGLDEGQWPFSVALIAGFAFFVIKLAITKFNMLEWLVNVILISSGMIVYFTNGHMEVMAAAALIIGIKNVNIKRAVKCSLAIWGSLFILTTIRALLGFYPGTVNPQTKVGLEGVSMLRYSLGFTHPNVLHITYLIIVLLILFCTDLKGRKLLVESLLLFVGNIYFFIYSVSYTGFITVTFCLLLNLYLQNRKRISVVERWLFGIFVGACFIFPIVASFVLPWNVMEFFNKLVNDRFRLAGETFKMCGLTLFGSNVDIHVFGLNLDCSFAYSLFYHGLFLFILYFVFYVLTVVKMAREKNTQGVSLMLGVALAGVTEQFAGNLSFKNISLLFIGDFLYNDFLVKADEALFESKSFAILNKDKEFSLSGWHDFKARFINYFKGTRWKKCILPAIGCAVAVNIIFNILWTEPKVIYVIVSDESLGETYVYHKGETDFITEDGLVAGRFEEGTMLHPAAWIDTWPETVRGEISSVFWGFLLGFVFFAFLSNRKKLNYVCIEDDLVDTGKAAPALPRCNILGVDITLTNLEHTVGYIRNNLDFLRGHWITTVNISSILKAHGDDSYRELVNSASLVLPTSTHLVSACQNMGYLQSDVVLEHELVERLCGIDGAGLKEYWIHSHNMFERTAAELNEQKADVIFVKLPYGECEKWMKNMEGHINAVMIGLPHEAGSRTTFAEFSEFTKLIRKEKKRGALITDSGVASPKKKLLIYAHYYAPDVASTGQILTELAEGMLDTFDITVIAVVPSYSGSIEQVYKWYRYYQQNVRGVRVVRVRVPEFTKASKISRGLNILSYFLRARAVTSKVGPADYVFSISQPPVLGGMLGTYAKKVKKAKFIYNIQDFNPEQVESVSYSSNKLIIGAMRYFDMKSCRNSDMIITVGRDLIDTIKKRFEGQTVPAHTMINNWVDEKNIYPLPSDNKKVINIKDKYGLRDKFVFMYSGNIGLYYDLDNIIKVIEKITPGTRAADGREVVFAFAGAGGRKQVLEEYVSTHSMTNVIFMPYQPKEDLNYSLNVADVHICVNAKGIKGVSCPSKYYGIAAAGKPVLASLEEGSEIRCIIEETNGGLVCDPADYDMLLTNIRTFIDMAGADELKAMGERSRMNLEKNLTKDISVAKYRETILNV